MNKKETKELDKTKLTLEEIISLQTKRSCSFDELDDEERSDVFYFIRTNEVDIRFFEKKRFDILQRKFFVKEFKASKETLYKVTSNTESFNSFSDFFEFLKGDIYCNSCFFGYAFSDEEIQKFSLNIENLNFNCFINYNIDDFSFDSLLKADYEENETKIKRAKKIFSRLDKCKKINSEKMLVEKIDQFTNKFQLRETKEIFFSYFLRKQKHELMKPFLELFCENIFYFGTKFEDILVYYGRDVAIKAIEMYKSGFSSSNTNKKIAEFKKTLSIYDDVEKRVIRDIFFDKELQLFVVKDFYINKENEFFVSVNYFLLLSELAEYVGGDFRGADFTYAPYNASEIEKFQTDVQTKFPLENKYEKYIIEKNFNKGNFEVKQVWLDLRNREIVSKEHNFNYFFDFVNFLKRDLSNANLLMCEGIENIRYLKEINIQNIKVRSNVAEILNLPIKLIDNNIFSLQMYNTIAQNEAQTSRMLDIKREENEYSNAISYISDIHLCHKFFANKCRSIDDYEYIISLLTNSLVEKSSQINFIAGDTCSNFEFFKKFMDKLVNKSKGEFFFVLGNHELWDPSFCQRSLEYVVNEFRDFTKNDIRKNLHLVHNNLYYLDSVWREIKTEELVEISTEELQKRTRKARLVIFGGVGFSGLNYEVNANDGIYHSVLNRKEEVQESQFFYKLYKKVTSSLKGTNLIILTHMPLKDWCEEGHTIKGLIYINGHSHRNFYYDDGIKRIFADNQIGYKRKGVSFKTFSIDLSYDWFSNFKDGIYEITRNDYENFYRGISNVMTFNRDFKNLYMIKRQETYMFLMKNPKGTLLILNGGSIKKACNHDLKYFYDNLPNYSKSVTKFIEKYSVFQNKIASEIKGIGGNGYIHGCIIDIDYYNHLYLNPFDGKVTTYFANSITEKYLYKNLISLLKYQIPTLYDNYEKLSLSEEKINLLISLEKNTIISKETILDRNTEIYKISRIIKGLQFTKKYNIVRLWDDSFADEPCEDNERLILSEIVKLDIFNE